MLPERNLEVSRKIPSLSHWVASDSHCRYNLYAGTGISNDVETIVTFPTDAPPPVGVITTVDSSDLGDHSLVQRAAAGDIEAFEELYRVNVGRVYALCLRMAGDPTLAEELAQEAFVRAWQKLGSFRGASAFSTWLHRVSVNVVLGHRRSTTRREARVRPLGDDLPREVAGREAGTAESIDLERAISSLPDGARKVFVLHDMEGFRHHEVSSLMGIAVGTSKAQLHRARKLLRKALTS
jgi:RNA polymerase sigma-70 factor (ECF subfamily)